MILHKRYPTVKWRLWFTKLASSTNRSTCTTICARRRDRKSRGKGYNNTHLPVYSDGCGSTCCFRFFEDTRGNSTRHFSSLVRCDRGCIWRFCRLYCLVGLFASDSSGWIEHNSQLDKKSWKHAFTRVLTPSGPGTPCCLDSPFPAVDTVVSSNSACSVSDSKFYSAFFPAQSKSTRARGHRTRPWQLRERRCRRVAPLDFLPTFSFHSFRAVSASSQYLIQFDCGWYSAEYPDLQKRLNWFKKVVSHLRHRTEF